MCILVSQERGALRCKDSSSSKGSGGGERVRCCYHVPGGFAVGAEPVRRPGEAPREGVSSKNGWGWGGVMREIGALVQGDGWV